MRLGVLTGFGTDWQSTVEKVRIAEDNSDPSTSARVAAWRELAERVIGPAQQRSPENHLHVNVTPEEMRAVARRLAASYGSTEPPAVSGDESPCRERRREAERMRSSVYPDG